MDLRGYLVPGFWIILTIFGDIVMLRSEPYYKIYSAYLILDIVALAYTFVMYFIMWSSNAADEAERFLEQIYRGTAPNRFRDLHRRCDPFWTIYVIVNILFINNLHLVGVLQSLNQKDIDLEYSILCLYKSVVKIVFYTAIEKFIVGLLCLFQKPAVDA
nr:hypothetical protein [Salmonid herpesvirus 1]